MKYTIFAIVFLGITIGYNVWLDSGCEITGYMTWHGKECVRTEPFYQQVAGEANQN